nr:Imm1 family immunity protein [Micromonospora sp. Llam0]
MAWDGPSAAESHCGNEVAVSTVEELDLVLDRVHAQAAAEDLPYAVQIYRPGRHGAIMIGIGHRERSFVDWLDRSQPHGSGNRHAIGPDLAPAAVAIAFDFDRDWSEVPPDRTRISPHRARAFSPYGPTAAAPSCCSRFRSPTVAGRPAIAPVRPIAGDAMLRDDVGTFCLFSLGPGGEFDARRRLVMTLVR